MYILPELPAEVLDVRDLLLVVLTLSPASLSVRSNQGSSKSLCVCVCVCVCVKEKYIILLSSGKLSQPFLQQR